VGTTFVEAVKELSARGVQKPSQQGRRKTVPGPILGGSCCDADETSRSENETRLEAAGLPGQMAAGVAVTPGPGSQPRHLGLPGMATTAMHAAVHGDDLLSLPDPEG
jgi:hypothetical protein